MSTCIPRVNNICPHCLCIHIMIAYQRCEVAVPGASELRIVFDEQSSTEEGADFLRFYKDKSCASSWGATYTGRAGASAGRSTWPGKRSSPAPLVIPADSFVLYWKTDGSVTDWGWKLTITPVFPPSSGSCSDSRVGSPEVK